MLQKSRSKTISKVKYLILVPLMLAMLTYVSCSDDIVQNPEENALSEFTYTVNKVEEMSAATEAEAKITRFENFLKNNPDHVGWATINPKNDQITYTVHSKEEPAPAGYHELKVNSPDGGSYALFMNLKSSASKVEKSSEAQFEMIPQDSTNVPFAIVEEVPIFPGCERLGSNQARKDCMSEKISQHMNAHFNTSLGKELGLEGVNKIYAQFKITTDGNIEILSTRAPHPALEAEVKRVVNMLPEMIPGKQKGKVVAVLYSLPITFRVSE